MLAVPLLEDDDQRWTLVREEVEAIQQQYAKGDKLKGTIKSITDFGIFIGLSDPDLNGFLVLELPLFLLL